MTDPTETVMRIIKFLILLPIAILVVAFCVANRGLVTLSLNPFAEAVAGTDLAAMRFSAPLYLLLFGFLLIGVLLGGMAAWWRQGKWRNKARSVEGEVAKQKMRAEAAEEQVKQLAPEANEVHPLLPALK